MVDAWGGSSSKGGKKTGKPENPAGSGTSAGPDSRAGVGQGGGSGSDVTGPTTVPIQGCDNGGAANSATGSASSRNSGTSSGGSGSNAGLAFSLTNGLDGFLPATEKSGDVEKGGKNPAAAPSPNVQGRNAIKVDVPSGAERSEVQPKAAQNIEAGQHMAFGISDFLPQGFPVSSRGGWQVIWQLHDGGTNGSPSSASTAADTGSGRCL